MADAVTPEEELIRAGHARSVLESAIFAEMRASIRGRIQEQIVAAPMADQTMHTRLVMLAQLWNSVERWFDQIAETGKLAEIQIEQEKQRKRFFQNLRAV